MRSIGSKWELMYAGLSPLPVSVGPAAGMSRGPSIDFWALSQITIKLRTGILSSLYFQLFNFPSLKPHSITSLARLQNTFHETAAAAELTGSSFIPPSIWSKVLEHRLPATNTNLSLL